ERPSVVPGNYILVVKCGVEDGKAYKGYVYQTRVDKIDIKFGRSFLEGVYSPNAKFDVRFTFNRVAMRRMHQALNNTNVNFKRLFPHNRHNYENYEDGKNNEQITEFYTSQDEYQKPANLLLKKLSEHLLPKEMIRIYATSQNLNKLDSDLHDYCIIYNGKFYTPTLTYIEQRQ
ncbi:5852_t:CDS:2, partial [Racocetra fulgida]